MAAAIKGYKLKLIMPSNGSEERRASMRAYGAELFLVAAGSMEAARDLANEMQARPSSVLWPCSAVPFCALLCSSVPLFCAVSVLLVMVPSSCFCALAVLLLMQARPSAVLFPGSAAGHGAVVWQC